MTMRRSKICFIDELLAKHPGYITIPEIEPRNKQVAIVRAKFDRIFRMYSNVFMFTRTHLENKREWVNK